jgi:N-methylhydantoinase B
MDEGAKGLDGAGAGIAGAVEHNGRAIGWGKPHLLHPGDRIVYRTAGGGGYGDPALRDADLVRKELRDGLITEAVAQQTYGLDVGKDNLE